MEGEIGKFILVWITVIASLCYCHTIAKFIPYGKTRLFFVILPIICLFLYIQLYLNSIHLGATSSFLIAWLANFKLLLFAFGKPPLSSYPPLSLPRFILLSTLPIKIQKSPSQIHITNSTFKYFGAKVMLLAIFIQVYKNKDYVHPKFITLLYCFHIYLCLEIVLGGFATLARAAGGVELEPQFDEPYLSTSLQDFWGKRWNLMVSSILRPTVYDPVRSFSTRMVGRKWASLPATLATFFVSAVMHELIFYYVGRVRPSFEVTWFFMIHGVCLVVEIALKKVAKDKIRVPSFISRPLVIIFVLSTALWLFFPPVLRCNADLRAKTETAAIADFVEWCFSAWNIFNCVRSK